MGNSGKHILTSDGENLSFFQRNLADYLTLSRVIISFVILSLSFVGKDAYIVVVILTLAGGATDILDGKAARHYLGHDKEGKLGKHDVEIDTLFVLSVMAYLTFSGIVVPKPIGLGWISLVLVATAISNRSQKVLVPSEILTVIALLFIALVYDLLVFGTIIAPAMTVGLVVNRRRVLYLIFDYWPKLFSR